MNKYRKIRYSPCTIICHGECEVIFSLQLRNKYRRNIIVLSKNNGKSSIMINTLNSYLKKFFPFLSDFINKNSGVLKFEKNKLKDHFIFSIMDKDDKTDKMFDDYKSGNMFKKYWWGENNLIIPIYFNPSMDVVFNNHGFKIDVAKEKPAQYLKIFTIQFDEAIAMLMMLKSEESNISLLLNYLNDYKD